ncbi:MBL fold metallo-hydrolase [Halalkalibacter alkaliphilus]|uniref:MBL fold metallo-hydrolase n=1 Tax=Halalkalibacter alkaliphilus TaxID=2917993 RepID=A0A9X2CW26_9BACI|nr:MBL fold metallo-hydrolase [Halalkalibacter alkaliphilus]MCL7749370.1 MBL fold metallo-hydrolase [Halalkalibacter alkaliphilus]
MPRKILFILCFITVLLVTACGTQPSTEQSTVNTAPEVSSINNEEAQFNNELLVHYINVGQADATLLEFSDETESYYILIDAGNWNSGDVVSYLQKEEISHIDILIGTHPHADHIGQMDQILDLFDVTEVWMSGDETTSQTFERVLNAVIESGVDYHEPRAGEVYDIGPLAIEVINPDQLTGDIHEGSISLRATYGEVSFLFTGDAEEQTEQAMIDRGHQLDSTVLQLGHHGSSTSTTPAFLEAVNPEVAIISAGIDNQYGHPHDEVVSRVENAKIDLYTTFVHGTIIVSTDGKNYNVTTDETEQSVDSFSESTESLKDTEIASESNCIDINSASASELEDIIHIGTERASQLIDLRPFEDISDLARINGIGPARITEIKTENLACMGG